VSDRTALHTLVFDSLEEQIAVIDQAGAIVDVNSAWTNFGIENGLSSGFACVGGNYLEVLHASTASGDHLAAEAARGIQDVFSGKCASFHFEYPCHSPEEKRWFMMRVTGLKGGSRSLFVISHHNITQRKLAEERAEYLALHDPLTGLANRRYFSQFLGNEMRRGIRNRSAISLIEFDVDCFKDYNDTLGHPAGGQCLVNVSQALQAFCRRPGDLAARLGCDEFALILGDTDFAESQKIGNAIRTAISDLNLVYGGSRQMTISLGVASVIPDRHQPEEYLLQEADKALYGAKSAGRNRVAHVQPVANMSGRGHS
jgi:diguanylate cyclase (GGDEF)-like protein